MNDATFKATCDRINPMIDRLREELGFNSWVMSVRFLRERVDGDDPGDAVAMEISSSWEYRELVITVYVPTCSDLDDDRLEMIVWHEFMHAMVSPMRQANPNRLQRKLEEMVCTQLSQAFFYTVAERRRRWDDERKLEEKRAKRDAKKLAAKEAA